MHAKMIVHYFGRKMKTLINVRCVRRLGTRIHVPKVRRFLIRYALLPVDTEIKEIVHVRLKS